MTAQIYSSPAYSLGATEVPNVSQKQAEAAIKSMQRSLKGWLKVRLRMDEYAAGKIKPPRMFRSAKPLPPAVVRATLRHERYAVEQDLATTLHALLLEMGCSAKNLPKPDVATDPDAAVKLADVAIKGACQNQALGIVWFAIAIPVAGIAYVISQSIKSKADVAKVEAENRCKESGACTDSGFWIKWSAIIVGAWVVWDKFGLREKLTKKK